MMQTGRVTFNDKSNIHRDIFDAVMKDNKNTSFVKHLADVSAADDLAQNFSNVRSIFSRKEGNVGTFFKGSYSVSDRSCSGYEGEVFDEEDWKKIWAEFGIVSPINFPVREKAIIYSSYNRSDVDTEITLKYAPVRSNGSTVLHWDVKRSAPKDPEHPVGAFFILIAPNGPIASTITCSDISLEDSNDLSGAPKNDFKPS